MMSNSENMTVSERLAQRLKSSTMGELLDEDDLTAICQQAITKAFFDPVKIQRQGYSHGVTDDTDPVIVVEARKLFREHLNAAAEKVGEALAESPEFKALIIEAVISSLPGLVSDWGLQVARQVSIQASNDAMTRVGDELRRRFGQ